MHQPCRARDFRSEAKLCLTEGDAAHASGTRSAGCGVPAVVSIGWVQTAKHPAMSDTRRSRKDSPAPEDNCAQTENGGLRGTLSPASNTVPFFLTKNGLGTFIIIIFNDIIRLAVQK